MEINYSAYLSNVSYNLDKISKSLQIISGEDTSLKDEEYKKQKEIGQKNLESYLKK